MPKPKIYKHPNKLNVGYKCYEIIQRSLECEKLYGYADLALNTITVDPNTVTDADYKGTLLHEILHVGYDVFGLGDDDEMPTFGNEYLTGATTNMLLVLQGLNPELFNFIFSNETNNPN